MSQRKRDEPERRQGVVVKGAGTKAQALASISQSMSGARSSGEVDTEEHAEHELDESMPLCHDGV